MSSSRIDRAKDAFAQIKSEVEGRLSAIETEADARFQLIDRVLTEVLFWPREAILTEPYADSGYIDYLIRDRDRNLLVIEAKRTASPLLSSTKASYYTARLSGPALASAQNGIEQARKYCFSKGVGFTALTTGLVWVGFRPGRDDGLDPGQNAAHLFPSMDAILADFAVFFDLFSQEGIGERRFHFRTDQAEGASIVHFGQLHVPVPDTRVTLAYKSSLAAAIDTVFDRFFRSISDNDDPDMLIECFVESRESREADAALQKIAREIFAGIQSSTNRQLTRELEFALESRYAEIILIVGNKGAGKSTFVSRFFKVVVPNDLKQKCLVLLTDLGRATADISSIDTWLTNSLLKQLECALFPNRTPDYDELLGIFFSEYQRWSNGEMKHLYESDRTRFKIEFGQFMRDESKRAPYEHLIRLLRAVSAQRQMLPCILFDNADQFSQEFQEHVFQYAHSIHKAVRSFVIVPITDRTIWQLSKHGPLQSYPTKPFYLPVPSVKDILEKRVNFIRRRTATGANAKDYFTSEGIRLTIENLNKFTSVVEEVFVSNDFVSRRVSFLANLDIRRSLELSRRIITSPVLQVDDLLSVYVTGEMPQIPYDRIVRAMIRGGYNHFNDVDSSFIHNVFTVSVDNITSPLLVLSLLRLLTDKSQMTEDITEQYLTVEAISAYFEAMGLRAGTVEAALPRLLLERIIEPYDPTDEVIRSDQRLRVTPAGRMHLEMATQDAQYISEMALRTRIRDAAASEKIRQLFDVVTNRSAYVDFRRTFADIRDIFAEYCLNEDRVFCRTPNAKSYMGQIRLREDFAAKWVAEPSIVPGRPSCG